MPRRRRLQVMAVSLHSPCAGCDAPLQFGEAQPFERPDAAVAFFTSTNSAPIPAWLCSVPFSSSVYLPWAQPAVLRYPLGIRARYVTASRHRNSRFRESSWKTSPRAPPGSANSTDDVRARLWRHRSRSAGNESRCIYVRIPGAQDWVTSPDAITSEASVSCSNESRGTLVAHAAGSSNIASTAARRGTIRHILPGLSHKCGRYHPL